jgi:NAD(P)-dependent dehydrogenase (short-subunit alcohol dehydrogenase family)
MDLGLKGRVVLVTGSTQGIGRAAARRFLGEGASVVINGRTEERVARAVEELKREFVGGTVRGAAGDVGTVDGTRAVTDQVPDVDVLVNNAGIFEPKPFVDIPDEDWLAFFQSNVMSGVRLARHYFPRMLKKNWGRILFISSESAVQIPAEMIHYGVTKTAQLAVARGLAELTSGTGVTVNSVLPGPTRSEGVDDFIKGLAKQTGKSEADMENDFFRTARPSSLLRRFATTDEVANMIVYVASEAASATNGASLRVDGGVVRSIV